MVSRLSVVMPTKDCLDLLRHSLPALQFADEIIVVDDFSTDGSADYIRTFTKCRLLQRSGYIFENVNAGIDAASGDWVMRIDSDEVCTPDLGAEIRHAIQSAPSDVLGFRILSRTYYCQRWLKYGPAYDEQSPNRGERYRKMLFRRGAARYACKSEHEDLTTVGTGEWKALANRYDHYSIRSYGHYIQKINYYTDRDADRIDKSAYRPRSEVWAMLWAPLKTFLVFYFKRKGFKDGPLGIMACGGYAISEFLLHAKRWERLTSQEGQLAEDVRQALERTQRTHLLGT
jgi:glycosyltransferase involved in cell wall biosynthesis